MTKDYLEWSVCTDRTSDVFRVVLETSGDARAVERILRTAQQSNAFESAVERLLRGVEAQGTEQSICAAPSSLFPLGFVAAARNFSGAVRIRVMFYDALETSQGHPLALVDEHCAGSKLIAIEADDSVFV